MRSSGKFVVVVPMLVLAVGCGPGGSGAGPGDGGEDVTPRALAAVLVDALGEPTHAQASEGVDYYGDGAVAATVVFGDDFAGEQVELVVAGDPPEELTSCEAAADEADGCEEVGDAVLTWDEEEPEEDPGTVTVAVPKGDAWAVATESGPSITGDPRDLDLTVSVDDLLALARDPRVGPTTTAAAVAAGDALGAWRGPDVNPDYADG
ncbi:MAG: hypothetical protein Q7T56_14810 [Nocardioidaceae bacterium]|nr:hypothetical protein [Nocardioidaceae bacterium]